MHRPSLSALVLPLLGAVVLGCGASMGDGAGGDGADAPDAGARGGSDGGEGASDAGTEEEVWIPQPLEASRFAVFYQLSNDVLSIYADPQQGLPMSAEHAYIFAISHQSVGASRMMADQIHAARADFKYAPCFDLNNHTGWGTATDLELATMAHEFREEAIHAHADFFCLNEAYTNIPTSDTARVHLAKLIRYINEPDGNGAQLRAVFFLTEAAATPSKWTSTGSLFWQAVNDVSDAVVAEHYHGYGYVCANSEEFLAGHFFALRRWFEDSGEPAKLEIAAKKFVVLHSMRYAPGTSGWAGGNSDTTSLAAFQRDLSKLARITRSTDGGVNRISFGPAQSSISALGVQPRITGLLRWHYGEDAPAPDELDCIAGADSNCQCE